MTCGTHKCKILKNDGCCDYIGCGCPSNACIESPEEVCEESDARIVSGNCPECMSMTQQIPSDTECCGNYINKCQCKGQADLPSCDPECEDAIDSLVSGICGSVCNYKIRVCKPKDHCKIDGVRVEPGQAVSKKIDPCTTCSCPSEPNELGQFKAVCHTQCCTDCPAGHSRIPQPGQCCGRCMPLTCTDAEGNTKAVGDEWSPMDDQCIKCMCKDGIKSDVYAECFSTRQVLIEGACPPEFIEISEDGCIERCTKDDDSVAGCSLQEDYTGIVNLEIDGEDCVSVDSHRISMCSGGCASESIVTGEGLGPKKQCNCCTAMSTEEVKILFDCNGNRKEHTINVPTQCACDTTRCEAPTTTAATTTPATTTTAKPKSIVKKAANKVKSAAKSIWGKFKKWG
jgi:hypothetical protein